MGITPFHTASSARRKARHDEETVVINLSRNDLRDMDAGQPDTQITVEPSNQNTIAKSQPEHTIQDVLLGKITLEELADSEMA
ncbi:hypothetical protein AB0L13_44125 [Saccharopolyspora shandongensis]|uniref:hypothetical protein n=1 Tax=Saccharopolyspora shandongensis TaxID=418495 RepID=UPI00341D9DF3